MASQIICRRLAPICRLCSRQNVMGSAITNTMAKRNFLPARRPPNDPFTEIQRSFEHFFRDLERSFFAPTRFIIGAPSSSRTLPMETIENGQRIFRFEIDMPDFRPEDINVTVKKGQIKIEGKMDISDGSFAQAKQVSYSYALPEDADLDKVRSMLTTDGRLVIDVPLPTPEAPKENQEITIKREL